MKAAMRLQWSLSVVAFVIAAAACSSSATSPASPSVPSAGATIQGTVQTGAAATSAELSAFSTAAGIKVTVVGTSLSTTTDGSGHFVLAGVAGGSATLRFHGQGIDGTVELSGLVEGQTLTVTVRVSGSRPELISPASPASPSATPSPGKKVEFDGTVESVTPPTLKVAGQIVVTNGDTKIKRSGQAITLGDVKVGDKVEVEGVAQPDGSVLASKIKVEDDENDDDQGENEVEFQGTIQSITPPTLMVSGRTVVTNGSTRIRSGDKIITLTDLKPGEKVEVDGTRQADGSVLASKIKVEDGGDDEHDDGGDN
jgi:uncharacterized protein DUF5666